MASGAVELAERDVHATQAELKEAIDALADTEPVCWSTWVDAQVREYVGAQAEVFLAMTSPARASLKASIAKVRDAQAVKLRGDALALVEGSEADRKRLTTESGWREAYGSYGEEILAVLRRAGFDIPDRWISGEWHSRKANSETPALHEYPQNSEVRSAYAVAWRANAKAVEQLDRLRKSDASAAALAAWEDPAG